MKVLLLSIFIIGHTGLFIANAAKNPDPKRFSDSFEKFVQEDTKEAKLTRPLTLFTGSSSIRRWDGLEKDFPQHNPLNRGFGGAHISDMLHYYDQLFPKYKPERIVMYCGENDLWSGKSVSQVFEDFQTLWKKIRKDLPSASLIYLSCKPSPKRFEKWNTYQALNLRIKNFCLRDDKLDFVDLSPTLLKPSFKFNPTHWDKDQLHVNRLGYDQWRDWLRPVLKISR